MPGMLMPNTVEKDLPAQRHRGALYCMAIFWRALDGRTHKLYKDQGGRVVLLDRNDWQKTCPNLGNGYTNAALTARRGAAMSIVYQAREAGLQDTGKAMEVPDQAPALGNKSILDHLRWIPGRFRLQFAQIIHFALVILVTRLVLHDIPSAIKVDRLKFWLVKDFRAFAGQLLADHLQTWLDEVERRIANGEVGLFNSFEFQDCILADGPNPNLKYEPFGGKQKGLFFHVWRGFSDYGEYDVSLPDPDATKF